MYMSGRFHHAGRAAAARCLRLCSQRVADANGSLVDHHRAYGEARITLAGDRSKHIEVTLDASGLCARAEFWEQVMALARELAALPRSGDTVYGFAAGLYPTDFPTLPDPDDEPEVGSAEED
jgi:hypothetical protein